MKQTFKYLVVFFVTILMGVSAFAQVTTSAIGGKVVDEEGQPVVGAAVIATHEPSGTVYGVTTNENGRFDMMGLRNGGPYIVEISSLGFQSVVYTDIELALAEMYALNATMKLDTEKLGEAIVVAAPASKFAGTKMGAATNISTSQIEALPSISRNIDDLSKLSPYGGNGMSFAGGDGRSSNFTVDGANFNNNFGLNDGLPGGGSPISIDAIDEVQVVIAPYDVRQTNFIGGGMNAVTKSGTNTFKGSAYVYHRNENMRGNYVCGQEIEGARDKDRNTTYGFTLGGPIIKNKLFFFVNFEQTQTPTVVNRWRVSTDGVGDADKYISRVTAEDMDKVKNHLMDNFGYDAGSYTNWPANESNTKVLARIDWNITDKHRLALRYNFTTNNYWQSPNKSSSNCGQRTTEARMSQYGMSFTNSMYSMNNNVHTASLDLNSRITDNLSNQLLVTFSKLDDVRGSNSSVFPFIDILEPYTDEKDKTTNIMPYISAGYELFTHNNAVHNTVVTVKDDVTYYAGDHKITAGLSYEYQMADNAYMRNGTIYYRYKSLNDFLNFKTPETVALTYGYDGETNPAARVQFHQIGLYAQEEWNPVENFTLTAGLRLDGIAFDNNDLMTNAAIKNRLDYGGRTIDTGMWPKFNVQVSPRIGFNWDILNDNSLTLRGGTGIFAGRLPLVFFTNMPSNSGMVQNLVSITTKYNSDGSVKEIDPLLTAENFAGKENFVTDINKMIQKLNGLNSEKYPTTISPDKGVLPDAIQAVDPDFKMPQVWKTSIAIDYKFPTSFPFSISGEFMYNKTINGVCLTDWNVRENTGWATWNGPDKRRIYPANTYYNYYKYESSTGKDYVYDYPAEKSTPLAAYVLSNTNKGYGYTANVMLNIEPVRNLSITASYTHTVQKEISGMPGSNAESAFTYTPTISGPNFAELHNSSYVTPDRFFASVTYSDKGNNHFSLFYETWRGGANYSYMFENDVNGDNYNYDLIYIPTDAQVKNGEFRFLTESDATRFMDFVHNDPYLSKNQGKYAEAYSVYSPWVHRLDFRYAHDFKVKIGNSMNTLQLSLDLKNALNLFNPNWGVSKFMNSELKGGRILTMDHLDVDGVPVYSTNSNIKPGMKTWEPSYSIGQCWYLQVGIKYMFN